MLLQNKSVISRHLKNTFDSNELDRRPVVAKNATVQSEGSRKVTRNIDFYNLDVIISVGYRVNSKQGVGFSNLGYKNSERLHVNINTHVVTKIKMG